MNHPFTLKEITQPQTWALTKLGAPQDTPPNRTSGFVKPRKARCHTEARDVPLEAAARRLGKNASEFKEILPNLITRGFPKPDPDTGYFDLIAIDKWCDSRHPHLFGGNVSTCARDARVVANDRIQAMRNQAA
jgi:hypothetical protein